MAKKEKNILFQLGREITIGEESRTELRLGLMRIQLTLDETCADELILMFASANMGSHATEVTKLEVNAIWSHYSQVVLYCSVRMIT